MNREETSDGARIARLEATSRFLRTLIACHPYLEDFSADGSWTVQDSEWRDDSNSSHDRGRLGALMRRWGVALPLEADETGGGR